MSGIPRQSPNQTQRPPVGKQAGRPDRSPFVGRQAELLEIDRAVRSAIAGTGNLVIISGESGIGKTRLLEETRRQFASSGGIVLHGECQIEAGKPPFQVWTEALSGLVDRSALHVLAGSLTSETTVPYSSWRSQKMSFEQSRYRMFSDVLAAVQRETTRSPLLVTLDDLQWSDLSSLDLLRFLSGRCAKLPFLIVGAIRAGEPPAEETLPRLVEILESERKCIQLEIQPLSAQDVAQVVAAMLGYEDSEWADLLANHCEGNPFVLEETIRALHSSSVERSGRLKVQIETLPLPPSVTAAIRMRLDNLDEKLRTVVDLAAVAGGSITVTGTSGALEIDEELAANRLDRLVGMAIMRCEQHGTMSVTSYRFLHHWIREVALDQVSPAKRQRLNLSIAGVLEVQTQAEGDPAAIGAMASHFLLGGQLARASHYFAELGELMLVAHAPADAAKAFARAIDLREQTGSHDMESADLLMKLGESLLMTGGAGAEAAFHRAGLLYTSSGSAIGSGRASGMEGLALARAERHERAVALFETSLALLSSVPDADRDQALVLLHLSDSLGTSMARFDEALSAQRAAIALLGGSASDDHLYFEAILAMARTLLRINRLDDAFQLLNRALPGALKLGDYQLAAEIEGALANFHNWRGDIRQSRTLTLRRQIHAGASGDLFANRHVRSWLAFMEVLAGNWHEAERLLNDARVDVEKIESPEPAAFLRQITGMLALFRGEYFRAQALLQEALESFRQIDPSGISWYVGCAAYAAFRAGDLEATGNIVNETLDLIDRLPDRTLLRCPPLAMLGLVAAERGDQGQARSIFDELLPFSGQKHWVLIDRVLGVLACTFGDRERGLHHLHLASDRAKRFGLRPELAIVMAEQARFALNEEAQPQDALKQPIDRLRALGMEGEAKRFEAYLEQRSQGRTLPFPAHLSEREVQVLRLLAAGMTNNEIAAKLCISGKTVTNHLSHIFDKADLENRAAAAAFAVRHNLA